MDKALALTTGNRMSSFLYPYGTPSINPTGDFSSHPPTTIADMMAFAEADLAQYPRVTLAGFTISERDFVATHISYLLMSLPGSDAPADFHHESTHKEKVFSGLMNKLHESGFLENLSRGGKNATRRAMAEHLAWLYFVVGDEHAAVKVKVEFSFENNEHFDRCVKVMERPELHSFFTNGVWDIPFIERCVADDVEASLASSLAA